MPKVIPSATISATVDHSGNGHIDVEGGHLFVAYRVVQLSEGKADSKSVNFPGLNSAVNLPFNYQLQMRMANLGDTDSYDHQDNQGSPFWPTPHPTDKAFRCSVFMSVTNYNFLQKGVPVEDRWLTNRLDNPNVNGTYALNSLVTAQGLQMDQLVLDKFHTAGKPPNLVVQGGKVSVQRRTLRAVTFSTPKAPGWNQ